MISEVKLSEADTRSADTRSIGKPLSFINSKILHQQIKLSFKKILVTKLIKNLNLLEAF